jgi:CP family cyanate transporter-like MFS transporter
MTAKYQAVAGSASTGSPFVPLALLWLAGAATRFTVLALSPLLPMIRGDLGLSETEIGILSGSVPLLLFGLAAVPSSLLIARLGALTTVILGLFITAFASLGRGAAPDAALLYVTTIVLVVGVAIMQPALPPLVRAWMPERIGFATAIYTNGLLMSETLVVALTLPVVLPWTGGSWRWSIALWALPVLATGVLMTLLAPRPSAASSRRAPRRWWPDWRNKRLWRLAFLLACFNSLYFCAITFVPEYLDHVGHAGEISAALTALNLSQIPASLMMLVVAGRLVQRRASYMVLGAITFASLCGIIFLPPGWVVAWCAVLGFAIASALILILALPPLLSEPDDVHRLTAGIFTISYNCAVAIPFVSGRLWDLTQLPVLAFAPMALCGLGLTLLPGIIDFRRAPG